MTAQGKTCNKKSGLFLIGLALLSLWAVPYLLPAPATPISPEIATGIFGHGTVTLGMPPVTISVDVASDAAGWRQGMMQRKAFGDIQGMLFIFPDEAMRGFWMRNTPLALDIIFINSAREIVHIAAHATPMSEVEISSQFPVQYVLELPAMMAEQYGLETGDKVSWHIE